MPSGVYKRTPEKNAKKKNFLHEANEFLESKKDKIGIDVNLINKWQGQIQTLGEAIALDFDKAMEEKRKPIRTSLVIRIKSSNKKHREEFVENAYQLIDNQKTKFPEDKITISELKE